MTEPVDTQIHGLAGSNFSAGHEQGLDSREVALKVEYRFPELAKHQVYAPGSTRALLVQMLNECVLTGQFLETAKARRENFAERLQLSPAYLWYFRDIFASYNAIFPRLVRTPADDVRHQGL